MAVHSLLLLLVQREDANIAKRMKRKMLETKMKMDPPIKMTVLRSRNRLKAMLKGRAKSKMRTRTTKLKARTRLPEE